MSFNFRTPREEFASRLSTAAQDELQTYAREECIREENEMLSQHFNFNLPVVAKSWLTDWGVELSPFPLRVHSHPVCKTIENHILYRVVYPLLEKERHLHFLSIKKNKLTKLRNIGGEGKEKKKMDLSPINRAVTAKDHQRYGSNIGPHRLGIKPNSNLFIQDELHYWTEGQLSDFLSIHKPNRVIASIVYPVEALFGYTTSVCPAVYSFEIRGEDLIFFPDGKYSEFYQQPLSGGELLKKTKIRTESGALYSVNLNYTIGAHHVLTIQKVNDENLIVDSLRFFGPYPAVDASDLFNCRGRVPLVGMSVEMMSKIIVYLFSLKKPDVQSAVAKLRQLMNDDIVLDNVWVVRDLCLRIQKFQGSWSEVSLSNIFKDWLRDSIPLKKTKLKLGFLDDFERNLMKLKPLSFCIQTEKLVGEDDEVDSTGIDNAFWYNSSMPCSSYSGGRGECVNLRCRTYDIMRRPRMGLFRPVESTLSTRPTLTNAIIAFKPIKTITHGTPIKEKESSVTQEMSGEQVKAKSKGKELMAEHIDDRVSSGQNASTSFVAVEEELRPRKSAIRVNLGDAQEYSYGRCNNLIYELPNLSQRLKGRKVMFYSTNPELAYFCADESYRTYSHIDNLDRDIMLASSLFGADFNTVLIQEYDEGTFVGTQRFDEDCYDDDAVLIYNYKGSATFMLHTEEGRVKRKLSEGEFFLMKKGFNKNQHSEVNCIGGRISFTFRVQRRQISLPKAIKCASNKLCLVDAFAEILKDDKKKLYELMPQFVYTSIRQDGLNLFDCQEISTLLDCPVSVHSPSGVTHYGSPARAILELKDHHYSVRKGSAGTLDSFSSNEKEKRGSAIDSDILRAKLFEASEVISEVDFSGKKDRARKLLESLWGGSTGVNSGAFKDEGFRIIPGAKNVSDAKSKLGKLNNVDITVNVILGYAGSGKSRCLQNTLRDFPTIAKGCLIISPRRYLMEDWKEKCPARAVTFESALRMDRRAFHSIVLDEMTLFPNGYLDLLCSLDQLRGSRHQYYIVGDPLQSQYHNEGDSNRLDKENILKTICGQNEVKYLHQSYRINRGMGRLLGVTSFSEIEGESTLGMCADLPSARDALGKQGLGVDVVLVSSRLDKNRFEGENVMTFGESQGLTFKSGCILLTEETRCNSDNQVLVALTRFSHAFKFIYAAKGTLNQYKANCKGLLNRVLNNSVITGDYYRSMTPVNINLMHPKGKGVDEQDREQRLSGDPWLKSMIFLGQRVELEDEILEAHLSGEHFKVHLPISGGNKASLISELVRDKYQREIKTASGSSDQFRDQRRVCDMDPFDLPQCSTSESIYMNHNPRDDITFWASVKKRLRFADPSKNYAQMEKKWARGEHLFREFLKRVPLKQGVDPSLLQDCVQEFEQTKLKKSQQTLENHNMRSDPDTNEDMVKIFLKNQTCTKFEKRFCEGKAGQTIACFHHNVLVKFSPYCRYLEKKISQYLPNYIYIHQKKNFSELNEYVKGNFKGGVCVESDYESYDASQDALILAFEVCLMRHLEMPHEVIEDYIILKTTLGCKLGSLAIMRFSGEFGTFLFNTLANIAFTNMRYVWGNETILFAGDDMCAFGNLAINHSNDSFFERMTLKAKVNRTRMPMFCGWRLTEDGLYKEPALLYDRLRIAKERGRLAECVNSYFEEFLFAYKMGSRIELHMDEEQEELHYLCVRFFLVHEKYLSRANLSQIHNSLPTADEYSSGEEI